MENAQVCRLNGHLITAFATTSPGERRAVCPICRSATIDACEDCGAPIEGGELGELLPVGGASYPKPACPSCGAIYPWTQIICDRLEEVADKGNLSDQERSDLLADYRDLASLTPRTVDAIVRTRQVLNTLNGEARDLLNDVLLANVDNTIRGELGL